MRMKKLAVMALATALSVGSVMTASAAWLQEGSNWKYQNDNGTFQTGTWFKDVDGKWYHFDNNGIMQKGWFQDTDGKWYFLAYNGVMQVGLIKVDNNVYYMNASGDLFIGDMAINGKTYNFGVNGTTNGQPTVPLTATFGGNGNQSLSGGGSSSGGSGSSSTSSKSKLKTVGTVAELNDLAKEGYTNLKYATKDGGQVTLSEIADVDYSKVALTVDAPNQTIVNNIAFKQVTINAIKANTWMENAKNNIVLNTDARIVNEGGEEVAVTVATAGLQVKLEGEKMVLNITKPDSTVIADAPIVANVSNATTLVVNNTADSSVSITKNVEVEVKSSNPDAAAKPLSITTSGNATVKTAIPADITATTEIKVVVTHSAAAQGVTVKAADEKSDAAVGNTKVENESSAEVTVKVEKSDASVVELPKVEATKTTEAIVKEGIETAVKSANSSSYVGATIDGMTVAVTIKKSGSALVDTLPTARTIFNIFKSVDGVNYIKVDGYDIEDDESMIAAARELGFNGSSKLEELKGGSYDVRVYYGNESTPLEYTVNIK